MGRDKLWCAGQAAAGRGRRAGLSCSHERTLNVDVLQFSAASLFSTFRISQLSTLVLIPPCSSATDDHIPMISSLLVRQGLCCCLSHTSAIFSVFWVRVEQLGCVTARGFAGGKGNEGHSEHTALAAPALSFPSSWHRRLQPLTLTASNLYAKPWRLMEMEMLN